MDLDDPEAALRAARRRFVDAFDEICAGILRAMDQGGEAVATSRQRVHRLAGIAGVVGFRAVSRRALDLETLLEGPVTQDQVAAAVAEMRRAFAEEVAAPPPPWASDEA
jgi:HPt (histidine-containing phosphotransfer) domain-containing protein